MLVIMSFRERKDNKPLKGEVSGRVTAAVLGGGGSRRFGSSKALYIWQGKSLVDRVIESASLMTDDIYLLGGRAVNFPDSPVPVLEDLKGEEPTPLRGICAAIPYVREWLLLLACDIPFFDERVLRLLWEHRSHERAVVIKTDGRYHPYLALYPKSLLFYWQEALDAGSLRLQGIIEAMPKTIISEEDLDAAGVETFRIANINTPGDLEALNKIRL